MILIFLAMTSAIQCVYKMATEICMRQNEKLCAQLGMIFL